MNKLNSKSGGVKMKKIVRFSGKGANRLATIPTKIVQVNETCHTHVGKFFPKNECRLDKNIKATNK